MPYAGTALSAVLGLVLVASAAIAPATAAPGPEHRSASAPARSAVPPNSAAAAPGADGHARFAGPDAEDRSANRAFFETVMDSAREKHAARPRTPVVTVTYDTALAPRYRSQIAASARIWNSSVSSVRLQEGGNADFRYRQGDSARGSYAYTDGRGTGWILLDHRQTRRYDATRITAHETGHVLGLTDNYGGPCSELMSGGGAGTSCTNAVPDRAEIARVDRLWASEPSVLDLAGTLGTAH
ncbi:snapalysin family zinc-dependent metalloprotease [Streptomyces sp. 549]|uniref:snapalysin family zinc-dependent metalloprotease n=1 Tax=Streptomyces sp. 549 TaxID=3049076 RepID=UPI0024C3EB8E|nr:snapalysin family zinc-dependent metalloprotease [Streptomyces sp. 549]MDK1476500.1 snapalysin family zinc-dependent metalloprotease [Streptomyces sp. 549]